MKYSYSDLQDAARCLNKYRYRNVVRIEPRERARYFDEGHYAHQLLLGHYTSSIESAYKLLQAEIAADSLLFSDQITEQLALVDTARELVLRYAARYQDAWEILHAEESFEYELETGDIVTYTPDLIVRDADGVVWVVDHKTTSDGVPRELPVADLQVLMYLRGVREKYPECAGFIFNYLRKKLPTEPRLNKTGERRVNNLNSIDTEFSLLLGFLETQAPDLLEDADHVARLRELEAYDRFFFRQIVRVDDATLQRAAGDAAGLIAGIQLKFYPRSFVSIGPTSCQTCPYKDVCMGELLGYDVGRIIRENYKPRREIT